jgi:hypothetical protein
MYFKPRSGYEEALFRQSLFFASYFASSSLFFFPSTLPPHHERIAFYTTTLDDDAKVSRLFSILSTSLLHC